MAAGDPGGLYRMGICPMLITVDGHRWLAASDHVKQLCHVLLNSFGIRTAKQTLQFLSPLSLLLGHRSTTSHFTVGEVEEEVGVFLDGQVMVKRKVLGPLEGDETIDDDL